MRNILIILCIVIAISAKAFSQTYITNVTIVDVEKFKLLPEQTVIITNDVITNIQQSKKVKIPTNATVIDGTGKYLMPGMTDAHIHFFQSGGIYTRPDVIDLRKYMSYKEEISWTHNNMDDFLRRYTRAGITTVFDVGATNNFLLQRDTFANKTYAPTIYMSGALITTWEPEVYKNLKDDEPFNLMSTVEDAKRLVQQQLPFKPDFIKIWYIVDNKNMEEDAKRLQPLIKAVIDEAHKNNLKVAVHAMERITAQLAVESGCDFLVHDIRNEVVSNDFIKLLKEKKTIVCPTLIVGDGYAKVLSQTVELSYYEFTNSNPFQIGSFFDLKHLSDTALINSKKRRYTPAYLKVLAKNDSINKINLKKMSDAGITIAAGTDAGNIGTLHATSYISELKAMQNSGMTNWQVIQSATINGAKILNNENIFGSITIGKKANMVLLNANPIDNIDNLTKINLVVNKGAFINPDSLIKETPTALAQRQLNAYNARDIDAFLEPYADDVEIYIFPDELKTKGKENMREGYVNLFKRATNLNCEVTQRVVYNDVVVDKESLIGLSRNKREAVAMYKIENNKIKKVYFVK